MGGVALTVDSASAWYGPRRVLREVDLALPAGEISAVLGRGASGKTTLLRLFNRLGELERGFRVQGVVRVGERDVLETSPAALRRDVGMVFEQPTAFDRSIADNVAFGLVMAGIGRQERDVRIEEALRRAALWDEVSARLAAPASSLSSSARQQLCIARALALRPRVLLLDEITRHLSPGDASSVERVVAALVPQVTVVLASNDASLVGRLASYVALLHDGQIVEAGPTDDVFTNPRHPATQAFLSRRFA